MRERLDVVDERRPAEVPGLGGERRAQARHAATPFERLEHCRLLAADVRARAGHDLHGHRAQQAGRPELRDRRDQTRACGRVLLAQVNDRVLGLDEARRDRQALDEQMRPQLHDVAVFDRARLALVGVDDDDARPGELDDRRPLTERREAGAAVAHEPRRLELRQHGLVRVLCPQRLQPAAPLVVGEGLVGLGEAGRGPVVRRVRDVRSLPCPAGSCRRASPPARGRSGRDTAPRPRGRRPALVPAPSRAGRERRSSRRQGLCIRARSRTAPGGTSRTTPPPPPPPADVHVVGERVGELGRHRPHAAADRAEVVEQLRALARQLGDDFGRLAHAVSSRRRKTKRRMPPCR